MRTPEIALSADRGEDAKHVDDLLHTIRTEKFVVRYEAPLDLLLRDTISWFDVRKAPDCIISCYRSPFQDLKVIADLKKRPAYQWVPVFLIVNENIQNTLPKFLEYGATDVVRWPQGNGAIVQLLRRWLQITASNMQLSQAS